MQKSAVGLMAFVLGFGLANAETDLTFSGQTTATSAQPGENVSFTLKATNGFDASESAVGAQLQFESNGLTFVGTNTSEGQYDGATGVWSVPNVSIGQNKSIQLYYAVDQDAPAFIRPRFSVASHGDDDNINEADYSGDINIGDGITVGQTGVVDITLSHNVASDVQNVTIGDAFSWSLTVENDSDVPATNVVVEIPRDVNVAYTGHFTTGAESNTYNDTTRRWTIPTLAANAQAVLSFTFEVQDGTDPSVGAISQTAGLVSVDQNESAEANEGADAARFTLFPRDPLNELDLGVAVSASTQAPTPGGNVTLTVEVQNTSLSSASGITAYSRVPQGVTVLSIDTTTHGAWNQATGEWNIGDLGPGASARLTYTAQITAQLGQSIYMEATLYYPGSSDTTPEVNEIEINTTDEAPDQANMTLNVAAGQVFAPVQEGQTDRQLLNGLQLQLTPSSPTGVEGQNVLWTLRITNGTAATQDALRVQINLPAGLKYVSDTSGGNYNATTGVLAVPSMGVGENAQIIITTLVENLALLNNGSQLRTQASVTSPPSFVGLTSTSAIAPQGAELDMQMTVSSTNVSVGATMPVTYAVTNNGPADLTYVRFTLSANSEWTPLSDTATDGNYIPAAGTWTFPEGLSTGETATLTVTYKAEKPATLVHTFDATNSEQTITLTEGSVSAETITLGGIVTNQTTAQTATPVTETVATPTVQQIADGLIELDLSVSPTEIEGGEEAFITGKITNRSAFPLDQVTLVTAFTAGQLEYVPNSVITNSQPQTDDSDADGTVYFDPNLILSIPKLYSGGSVLVQLKVKLANNFTGAIPPQMFELSAQAITPVRAVAEFNQQAVCTTTTLSWNAPTTPAPTDVPADHPYRLALLDLFSKSIMTGQGNTGAMTPDQYINRAELSKMVLTTAKANVRQGCGAEFYDVPEGAWFANYVDTLATSGVISGYKDPNGTPTGQFGAGANVRYGEMAKIITRTLELGDVNENTVGHWAQNYVTLMKAYNMVPAGLQNEADYNRFLTRAEVADFLYRAMNQ